MLREIENCISKLSKKDAYSTLAPEEFEEILRINEDKDFDILPANRCIIIRHVFFSGNKRDGSSFVFDHEFNTGLNIVIADNFKGKSTIFKAIKLALTGDFTAIKEDIRDWFDKIIISVQLSDRSLTTEFNNPCRSRNFLANVYETSFSEYGEKSPLVFQTNRKGQYSEWAQSFFFDELFYYPLRWTSKKPRKEDFGLQVNATSWSTYYTSIYLESKAYGLMYGAQETKVGEMLLGLNYTSIINQLSVKLDLKKNELSSQRNAQSVFTKDDDSLGQKIAILERQIADLDQDACLQQLVTLQNQLSQMYTKQAQLSKELDSLSFQYDNARNHKRELLGKIDELEQVVKHNKSRKRHLSSTLLNLQLSKESRNFFSGLAIHTCPNCNTQVDIHASHGDECPLCHATATLAPEDEDWQDRINRVIEEQRKIVDASTSLQQQLQELYAQRDTDEEIILSTSTRMEQIQNQRNELDISSTAEKISSLEVKAKELQRNRSSLEIQLGVAKERLLDIENQRIEMLAESGNIAVELLTDAIAYFMHRRVEENTQVLQFMKLKMLDLIHKFGIANISDVCFNDKLDFQYIQNGTKLSFDGLAEGEQLRIKLAFYLALIELSSNNISGGKHSKLLIIDSPSKEEGDRGYKESLTIALQYIQDNYGDKLQIIVGTAERCFSDIKCSHLIADGGAYLF